MLARCYRCLHHCSTRRQASRPTKLPELGVPDLEVASTLPHCLDLIISDDHQFQSCLVAYLFYYSTLPSVIQCFFSSIASPASSLVRPHINVWSAVRLTPRPLDSTIAFTRPASRHHASCAFDAQPSPDLASSRADNEWSRTSFKSLIPARSSLPTAGCRDFLPAPLSPY